MISILKIISRTEQKYHESFCFFNLQCVFPDLNKYELRKPTASKLSLAFSTFFLFRDALYKYLSYSENKISLICNVIFLATSIFVINMSKLDLSCLYSYVTMIDILDWTTSFSSTPEDLFPGFQITDWSLLCFPFWYCKLRWSSLNK